MDTVTHSGCDNICDRSDHILNVLHNKHQIEYLDHVRQYRGAHPDNAREFRVFPRIELWRGRKVPADQTLRKRLEDAHYAAGSGDDDMSRHESNVRRMQSVSTSVDEGPSGIHDATFSSDHTFHTAQAFSIPGSGQNKVWNAATGFLKVLCVLLVSETSSAEFAHAAFWLAHRPQFKPLVIFTDNWPNDDTMWFTLLPHTRGRLDVFHFMKRISDALRPTHDKFHTAMAGLSRCIFQYDEDDVAAVKRALRNGTLNNTKHTETQINELIREGKFATNYDKYAASFTFTGVTIHEKIFANEDAWSETVLGVIEFARESRVPRASPSPRDSPECQKGKRRLKERLENDCL